MQGRRKLGFIGCFLIIAFLRLARIFLNPSSFFHIVQRTCELQYQGYIFLRTMCLSFLEYIHHEIYYLPLRCRCTCIEIKRNISWSILNCKWWLILLSAHWNEPIKRPGKVNGTYWMNVKADLNQLKADLKEIKWEHSQTCNPISDTMEWLTELACTIFMHSTMNFLNIIAIIFFVWRIFLFKFGWLPYKKRSRPPW